MAYNFGDNVSLSNNELQNAKGQMLAADPTGIEAKFYYNTVSKKFRFYNGTAWADLGGGAGDVVGPASSVNNRIALFDGTTGKLLKQSSLLESDIVTASSTTTFTNKAFDANGTGNSISNIEVADFAANVVDNDNTLAANSASRIPTQQAVKGYVDNIIGAQDGLRFMGSIDCSTNPNYPSANAGHVYKVSVAGKIGGASGIDVSVGDTLYCTVDGSAAGNQAAVGANWTIVQANVDRATETTLGLAEYATQAEAEAKTSNLVALTPASIVNFPQKKTFTIGDGVATSFALTHNLNTQDIVVSIRKVSTNEQWLTTTTCNTVNQVTLTFATAPTTNEFVVTVIG